MNKIFGLAIGLVTIGYFTLQHSMYSVASQNLKMVLIPAGSFLMGGQGEEDQRPIHKVFVDAFYIDVYEVNQKDFEAVMGFNPSKHKGPDLPVEFIDWNEAKAYCERIEKRLPTEAEWEKAARGDTRTPFYWGQTMKRGFTWYKDNSGGKTHPTGTKQPNAFGLYDMSGNVWEWVADWYQKDYYRASPGSNPTGPVSGEFKVQRGGSWSNRPEYHTSSYRMVYGPLGRDEFNGFRCAKSE